MKGGIFCTREESQPHRPQLKKNAKGEKTEHIYFTEEYNNSGGSTVFTL